MEAVLPPIEFSNNEVTSIICARCGKQTTIPFRPMFKRPLYCAECFKNPGTVGPPEVRQLEISQLLQLLGDKTAREELRRMVIWELGDRGDPQALQPLLGILLGESQEIQWAVLDSLGRLAKPEIVPVLEFLSSQAGNNFVSFMFNYTAQRIRWQAEASKVSG